MIQQEEGQGPDRQQRKGAQAKLAFQCKDFILQVKAQVVEGIKPDQQGAGRS